MKYTDEMIKKVSQGISNPSYQDNFQATKELMELTKTQSLNLMMICQMFLFIHEK